MESASTILEYIQKTQHFQKQQQQLDLVENLQYRTLPPCLGQLYLDTHLYPYILAPIYYAEQSPQHYIVIKIKGQPLSSLSPPQIHSYAQLQWLPNILKAYADMSPLLPKLSKQDILIDASSQPKFLPISCCSREEYLNNFRSVIENLFMHDNNIAERVGKIVVLEDIADWASELGLKKVGKSIQKLIELRNVQMKPKETIKIALSEEQKEWILSFTNFKTGQKLQLIYDGEKNRFDPGPLLQLAPKHQLLFLFQTTRGRRIAFWMNSKPEINPTTIFGSYFADNSKKSILLGLQRRSVHRLQDQSNSIGLGNEILISIGRADIVCSAFNCSNVSYFPCSYAKDEEKGVIEAQNLLGKEFLLRQLQVYKIN